MNPGLKTKALPPTPQRKEWSLGAWALPSHLRISPSISVKCCPPRQLGPGPSIGLPNSASDNTIESGYLVIILKMKDQALPGT